MPEISKRFSHHLAVFLRAFFQNNFQQFFGAKVVSARLHLVEAIYLGLKPQEKRQFLLECPVYCRLKMALLLNVG